MPKQTLTFEQWKTELQAAETAKGAGIISPDFAAKLAYNDGVSVEEALDMELGHKHLDHIDAGGEDLSDSNFDSLESLLAILKSGK